MSLEKIMDITISDRMSTQLQNEITIQELRDRVAYLEAEVKKYKTHLNVASLPYEEKHEVTLSINGVTKVVELTNTFIENYLNSSNPADALINDIVDVISIPYINLLRSELQLSIPRIIDNIKTVKRGSSL